MWVSTYHFALSKISCLLGHIMQVYLHIIVLPSRYLGSTCIAFILSPIALILIEYKLFNMIIWFTRFVIIIWRWRSIIIIIIFFVCSIMFESLRLPLAIISLIPVSFIGTFLTYWLSGMEFGTGGFASMVLLSGLTVNAGIYIVCEYRNQKASYPSVTPLRTYIRAYNQYCVPLSW